MTVITSAYLAKIADQLAASQVPWGVFAGAAACAYGSPRPLKDIDILIPSDSGDRVALFLAQAAPVYRSDGLIAELHLPDCEILAGLTENICLEMDAAMIERLTPAELLGVTVTVISIEDNIVFKAVLGRGPEVGKHDWEDIAMMLACKTELDWTYLRWRLAVCAPDRSAQIYTRLENMIDEL